ncbi:hypothetical protein [Methylibium sp.]|uniref:hypothetical protein n=1 Tax=Methylibium sp. TaxID=2067992 RepID=UPI0017A95B4A|nr:hypothetical protein [Methylibium sp.]MBA3588503.1 hypothetical protein [Methylibium sp.]
MDNATIDAIARRTADLLFDMGARDMAAAHALAREFAASANVHRSLAAFMRSGEAPVQPADEAQQVMEWSSV